MKPLHWRLTTHGIAIVVVSIFVRSGMWEFQLGAAFLLGWIAFPLMVGWPRDLDGKDGAK